MNETLQPVAGNWEEKDLREQFHDCFRDQNKFPETDRAQNVLQQMRLKQAEFTLPELTQYEEILTNAQEHGSLTRRLTEIGKGGPLQESVELLSRARLFAARLTEARPAITAQVGTLLTNERAHYCNRQLSLSRDALYEQYGELIRACQSTQEAAEVMTDVFQTAVEAFRNRSLSAHQLLQRIEDIERRFAHVDHINRSLRPQYIEHVPVLRAEYFSKGVGTEGEEMRRLLRLCRLLRTFKECSSDPNTITTLEKRLGKDTGGKIKFRLTKGAVLRLGSGTQERMVRILDTKGDPAKGGQIRIKTKNGKPWMDPGELYFHLLMETGHGCNIGEEKKTKGVRFSPPLETLDDLQHALGWDPKTESLQAGGKDGLKLISEKMHADVLIGNVDDPRGTIGVAHSYNKEKDTWGVQKTMSFEEFYDFKKKFGLQYKADKPEREWTATYWTKLKSERKGSGRSRLSIGGIIKGIKYLGEGFKRMGADRTEINGANLARWGADNLEALARKVGIPWLNGISDTIQTHTISLIMAKIDKWTEEYRKQLKTGELEAAFKDFYNLPKWKQAALLLAAGEKGLTKAEVTHILLGEGLDPSKWTRRNHLALGHQEYYEALYAWFVDKGDASQLPQKIESRLTPVLNSGWEKSRKTGFEESKMEFEAERIMDMHKAYYRRPDREKGGMKENVTKRERGWGTIQSLMKLGIDAQTLGRSILWFYSTVESSREDADKIYSSVNGDMMRQGGNMGKYLLPMMGLYRFPRGMALARAVIDFYWECTGQNPFEYTQPGQPNDAESTLGYLFAGQWQVVNDELFHQLGKDNYSRLKYLYYKMRAFAYAMEEGAGLSLRLPDGAELDEDTLMDAYGVSGMLSSSWLATILKTDESGSGQADHRNWVYTERTGQWWNRLPEKLNDVTEDEAKWFAHNFWEVLSSDVAVREQHFRRHWLQIAAVLEKLQRGNGPVKVEFGKAGGGRVIETYDSKDPQLFERINERLHEHHQTDPSYYIADLHLPHNWLTETENSIGKDPSGKTGLGIVFRNTIQKLSRDGVGSFITDDSKKRPYDIKIAQETRAFIKESEGWEKHLARMAEETGEAVDIQSIRNQISRVTGDNFGTSAWESHGAAESTD